MPGRPKGRAADELLGHALRSLRLYGSMTPEQLITAHSELVPEDVRAEATFMMLRKLGAHPLVGADRDGFYRWLGRLG